VEIKQKFWEDVWVGNSDLKSLFPKLYSLSLNQGHTVGKVGEWVESEWRWCLRWRRTRFEWEASVETDLTMVLSRAVLKKNNKDVQVWGKEVSGTYSVKSAYECIAKPDIGSQQDVFKILWKLKAFPNATTTAWRVLLGRMPTRQCLSRRGVLLNTMLCTFCQVNDESCQHLFL